MNIKFIFAMRHQVALEHNYEAIVIFLIKTIALYMDIHICIFTY